MDNVMKVLTFLKGLWAVVTIYGVGYIIGIPISKLMAVPILGGERFVVFPFLGLVAVGVLYLCIWGIYALGNELPKRKKGEF